MIMSQEKETVEVKMEKRQRFWDFLTMILSISYAILLLILGKIVKQQAEWLKNCKRRPEVERLNSR